jgi:hypothetical protein
MRTEQTREDLGRSKEHAVGKSKRRRRACGKSARQAAAMPMVLRAPRLTFVPVAVSARTAHFPGRPGGHSQDR